MFPIIDKIFNKLSYSRFIALIFILIILIRLIYFFLIPVGELPDEVYIFERIYHSAVFRMNSELVKNHTIFFPNSEYFYPPLYYFFNSFILQLFFSLNRTVLTFKESFFLYANMFRFVNFLLSAFSIYLVWKILNIIKLEKQIIISSLLLFGLLPTAAIFSNALNFHLYVFFGFLLFLYLLFVKKWLNNEIKRSIYLGLIVGVLLLIGFEGFMLIPLYPIYLMLTRQRKMITSIVYFIGIIFLISGWWYVANIIKFGNFYNPEIFKVTVRNFPKPFSFPNYIDAVIKQTSETFVFTAGRSNDLRFTPVGYTVWNVLFWVSLAGWIKVIFSKRNIIIKNLVSHKLIILFLLFIENIVVFIYADFKLNFSASQGRLFFPSLLLISIIFIVGIRSWLNKSQLKYLPYITLIFLLFYNYWGIGCTLFDYKDINILPKELGCFNYLKSR